MSLCYLAYLKNYDVLLLLPEGDLQIAQIYLNQSQKFQVGSTGMMQIPAYQKKNTKINTVRPATARHAVIGKPKPSPAGLPETASSASEPEIHTRQLSRKPAPEELSYEQLAQLSDSVVMISIRDRLGSVIGTGSGIAISKKGYILTNCHVVTNGCTYAVKLENDAQMYISRQVIKYHTLFDMAVIQIDRELKPLKIYNGRTPLVRGQKVAAIGSPLGLFNSVSDGIISGFREIQQQNMIQFTAAISSGSSGGALLNTYGEVIGMSTAVISNAQHNTQNINLAVSYEQIFPFVQGFLDKI